MSQRMTIKCGFSIASMNRKPKDKAMKNLVLKHFMLIKIQIILDQICSTKKAMNRMRTREDYQRQKITLGKECINKMKICSIH